MKRLALIIGHNREREGASSPYLHLPGHTAHRPPVSEFDFWTELANEYWGSPEQMLDPTGTDIVQYAFQYSDSLECAVFARKPHMGGYKAEMREAYSRADAWVGGKQGLTVELHFNSIHTAHAGGSLVLHYNGSRRGAIAAAAVQAGIVYAHGAGRLQDRGLRPVSVHDRGGYALVLSKHPSVLIEPFFGSNPDDCAVINETKGQALANSVLAGAAHAMELLYTEMA